MSKPTDVKVVGTSVWFLPVETRVPLKFGAETLTHLTCVRVRVTVAGRDGRTAEGWGETPLSVQWVWPGSLSYEAREDALKRFCLTLAQAWARFDAWGHPMEIGHDFQTGPLTELLREVNAARETGPMPWLAALVCSSPFDIALHDAYGQLHGIDVYQTYNADFMNHDLAHYLTVDEDSQLAASPPHRVNASSSFQGKYPPDFFVPSPPQRLLAWHLVGGLDPLHESELTGSEPDDGYPVLLADWIRRDGLKCLKIKLRGNDAAWDYDRLVAVGRIAIEHGVDWLTTDFNCMVREPAYVNDILDRLMREHPRIYGMILYVEQPFPYELEANRIDVHSVSARKPLFMDESAHDWRLVRLGRQLGWTGVALKTCKTQTGALLSACWAKAHGMTLMVQDLTNPMLAQIPHVRLAAQVGTIAGVETNATQFYPDASAAEERVHPGLYRRREGCVDLSSIRGPGFGYRVAEMARSLPAPAAVFLA
ncbi:MAG TPA: enolase C-terminal domain-like protein [Phycisphaerae bacterium]|nr:enolase C-terminal domain-like protein [Phycisphaerae bacterium]HOJ72507.1 enolase C-terminal domain-like protein [Phycisphaerae bacterium]HOM49832.1 enolase C-terminal domain-like protein [Phycisphaerae bacterium]HON65592.1 enolase C-terminal domain-like protein [Phycisphaerae bacterium]HOQ84278.1 enolase C-terminal domain-like protein [Phycisphaerae bacterium]